MKKYFLNKNYLYYYTLSIILLTPLIFSNDTIRVRLFKSTFFLSAVLIGICWADKLKTFYKIFIPILLYIFLSIISALFSEYYPYSFIEILNTLAFTGLFVLLLISVNDLDRFIFDLSIVLLFVLIIALLEHFNINIINLPSINTSRISGTLINPNFFGDFLSGLIPFFLFVTVFSENKKKILYYIILIFLGLIALLWSKSRTGFVSISINITIFVFAGLILSIFKVKKFCIKKWGSFILGLIIIILVLYYSGFASGTINRFKSALELDKTSPVTQRISVWESASNIYRDYALIGSGPGTFKYYYPMYKLPLMWEIQSGLFAEKAHQQYLEFLSEHGILGFLVFAFIISTALLEGCYRFIRHINLRPYIFAAASGMFGLAISSFASSTGQIFPVRMLFTIFLAVLFINYRSSNKYNFSYKKIIILFFLLFPLMSISKNYYADVFGYKASKQRLINKNSNRNYETIRMLNIARNFNPMKPNFVNTFNEVYGYDNDINGKIQNFQNASKDFFTFPLYQLNLANIYFNSGKFDEAELLYKQAARINLFYPNPYFMLGSLNLRKQDYIKAMNFSKHYLILKGNNPLMYRMLSEIYLKSERYNDLINFVFTLRSRGINDKNFSYYVFISYYKMNKKREALKFIEQEINLYRDNQTLIKYRDALKRELFSK